MLDMRQSHSGKPCIPDVCMLKGKIIGECCYREILKTLKVESITGDASLRYDFDGIFVDDDEKKYRINQSVTAGPANMGYAVTLRIDSL